ncbi:MAG TPA: hypothetical protein VNZ52_07065, partial [Candidatus Thermoplasmatota archaeon]|nr:hypothetical protein [Candidatus Thermoplasmatota archaeon]
MTLHRLQEAIAALLYEPATREAFARDPRRWATLQGLAAEEAKVLASVPLDQVDYFRELQARDRAYFVEALFPLTLRLAEDPDLVAGFLAASPYGEEENPKEAASFREFVHASHRGSAPRERALRDLAAYEAALAELRVTPVPEPTLPLLARLQPTEHLGLAPGLLVLRHESNLPELVTALEEGATAFPRRAPGVVVLRRADVPGGVESAALDPLDGEILSRLATGATVSGLVALFGSAPAVRRRLPELLEEGVIVRVPLPPQS